jgi:hypothetical protein
MPEVVDLVRQGDLAVAFEKLTLRGVGPKLRAFVLRDLVTLFDAEERLRTDPESYMWCQPVDVWVRFVANQLRAMTPAQSGRTSQGKYPLTREDLAAACTIVDLSLDEQVSPLKVNQGIWYFCANVVADQQRLRELVASGDESRLAEELALMQGFMPVQPAWG